MAPSNLGQANLGQATLAQATLAQVTLAHGGVFTPVPIREILPWAVLAGLLFLLAMYFVGVEEGAMAIFNGMYVHEFVHDGRHLLGFPCH